MSLAKQKKEVPKRSIEDLIYSSFDLTLHRTIQGFLFFFLLFLGAACAPSPTDVSSTEQPKSTATRTTLPPTPTPTLALEAKGIHVSSAGEPDLWLISGLIENQSRQIVSSVEIQLTVFDTRNDPLAIDSLQLPAQELSPGEMSPFQFTLRSIPQPDYVAVQTVGYQLKSNSLKIDLETAGWETSLTSDGRWIQMGVLTNPSDQWVRLTDSYGIVLDEHAEVIEVDTYIETYTVLPPSESVPFLTQLHLAQQGEIEIYADGHPIDPPVLYELEIPADAALLENDQGKLFLLGSVKNLETSSLDVILHFSLQIGDQQVSYTSYASILPLSPGETRFFLLEDLPGLAKRVEEEELSLEEVEIQMDQDRGTEISTVDLQPLDVEVVGFESTGSTLLLQCVIQNPSSTQVGSPSVILVVYQIDGSPLTATETTIAQEILADEEIHTVLALPLPVDVDLMMTEFDLRAFGFLP
jgi:hypothetical protein